MTHNLTPETRLIVTDGEPIAATWAEILAANDPGDEEIEDVRRQLEARGCAIIGGGAAYEVRAYLAIDLPDGWTWERVEAERAKWGIDWTMVPVATVPGACTAWGTINSVLQATNNPKQLSRDDLRREAWNVNPMLAPKDWNGW